MKIQSLEIHASHGCNLNCESCSHYSNHHRVKGMVSPKEADAWMKAWSQRLSPKRFYILGGEPTLNKELPALVEVARSHWENTKLDIVTNGFFLHRHPDLPKVLKKCDTRLSISVHHKSPKYMKVMNEVKVLVRSWQDDFGIRVVWEHSIDNWTRRYFGFGDKLQPYSDNDPAKSFCNCAARHCRCLFNHKLYKCPQLAYLIMVAEKYDLSEEWAPYLQYQPLSPDCSDEELEEWVRQKEIPECSMCAAQYEPINISNPMNKPWSQIKI